MKKYLILVMLTIIAVMPVEAKKKKFPNGDYYEGGWKKKSPHGEGTMIYANGEKYVGFWEYGKKNGQGIFTYKNGSVYDGQWYQDEKRGQGKYKIDDLTVIGEWNKNQIRNATISKSGKVFKGLVEECAKNDGSVVFCFRNGRLDCNDEWFDGEWYKQTQIESVGCKCFKNGNCKIMMEDGVFEGTMRDGEITEGIWKNSIGDYMEGTWKNGKFYDGKYIVHKADQEWNGKMINGKFEGYCSVIDLGLKAGKYQVESFTGTCKTDTLIGKMTINGKYFDGELLNGKKCSGILVLGDVDFIDGHWENDVLITGTGQFENVYRGIRQIYNFSLDCSKGNNSLMAMVNADDGFSASFNLNKEFNNEEELLDQLRDLTLDELNKDDEFVKALELESNMFIATVPTNQYSPQLELLFDVHALESTIFFIFYSNGNVSNGVLTQVNGEKLRYLDRGYLLQQTKLAERESVAKDSFYNVEGDMIIIDGKQYKFNKKAKQLLDVERNITFSAISEKEINSDKWEGFRCRLLSMNPPQAPSSIDSPQLTKSKKPKSTKAYSDLYETPAQFPGGDEKLYEFIIKNLKYPRNAIEKKISGRVILSFEVKSDGSISDIKVVKGVGSELDEEAVRLVKSMPKWKPAIDKDGRRVSMTTYLPISFVSQ